MNRKKFIKFIENYGFISTGRQTGSHEVFKSERYNFIFTIPAGNAEIKKAYLWAFRRELLNHEKLQMKSK